MDIFGRYGKAEVSLYTAMKAQSGEKRNRSWFTLATDGGERSTLRPSRDAPCNNSVPIIQEKAGGGAVG